MVSFISFAVLSALVTGCLTQDPEPCCFPPQWQADLSQGRAILGEGPVPIIIALSNKVYVDIPNQRAAIKVEQMAGDNIQKYRIVQDYSQGVQYIIRQATENDPLTCEREETIFGPLDPCALHLANATFMRNMVLGLGLNANMWRFEQSTSSLQMTAYTTVAPARCTPIYLFYHGALVPIGTPIMSSIMYSDFVIGPVDGGIFELPPECQAAFSGDNVNPYIPDWVNPWFQHLATM